MALPHSSIGFLTKKNVGVENLSIDHFQGLNPVMSMVDKGPVTLTFPVPKNPGIFVVTGVLREHDMDIFKEVYSCFRVFSCYIEGHGYNLKNVDKIDALSLPYKSS